MNRSPYINGPDILFCHESRRTRQIKLDFEGVDMLPAGTPISCEGKVANDVTALGVLLYDTWKDYGSGQGVLLIGGHLQLDAAQAHCGLAYTAEAKAAMKGICFVGDTEAPGGASSWNDLQDKPFGEEVQRIESIPTVTATIESSDGEWLNMEDSTPADGVTTWADYTQAFRDGFEIGKRYLVVWDGTGYECESHDVDGEVGLGNDVLSGWGGTTDNGLPFLFLHYYGLFGIARDAGEHTFAIYELTETTKTIDPKYLPDDHINSLIDTKLGVIENGTY